jgi:hypothetical protein
MKNNKDQIVGRHFFEFNPTDNSGEGLTLVTEVLQNGDGEDGIFLNQELTLQSYCNAASFVLMGTTLTPTKLRQLADELEAVMDHARKVPVST